MEHDVEIVDEARGLPWTITDEGAAAWAADAIASAEERLERIKAMSADAIARAERDLADTRARLLPELIAWYRAHPPRKGKTLHFPTAKFSARTRPGGPRIVDKDAAREWARAELPEAIRTRVVEDVDAAAIKGYVATFGDLPPGVELVPAEEVYEVKGLKPAAAAVETGEESAA